MGSDNGTDPVRVLGWPVPDAGGRPAFWTALDGDELILGSLVIDEDGYVVFDENVALTEAQAEAAETLTAALKRQMGIAPDEEGEE